MNLKVQNGQCGKTDDDVYVRAYDPYMRVVVSCNKDDAKRYLTYYRNVYRGKRLKHFLRMRNTWKPLVAT